MTSRFSVGQLRSPGLGVAGVAFGIVSVWLAWLPPGLSFAAGSQMSTGLELAAGWGLVVVGATTWRRSPKNPVGPLLALAGATWFLMDWTNPGTNVPLVFTLGLVFSATAEPLVGHALLAFPGGALHGLTERSVVGLGYVTNVLLLGLLPSLVSTPTAAGCSFCPQDLLALRSEPDVAAAIGRIGLVVAVIWVAGTIALLFRKMLHATTPARIASLPVIVPGSVFLGLFAIDAIHDLPAGVAGLDDLDTLLWQGQAVALIALVLGVASEWVRARRTRARVASLVIELAQSPRPGGLRDRLSELLDDPALVLAYPIGAGRFVDSNGQAVTFAAASGRLITPLLRDGAEVALLEHRAGIEGDPTQLNELVQAARLAIENERLQAIAGARLADLRASRAGVVEAGDAERRRLERDLHDGAQQRLVTLLMALRILRTRLAPARGPDAPRMVTALLDEAEAELRAAISDLRDVAHGIYPAILADEGLSAGVEALAEGSATTMTIDAMPAERFPLAIESAAYFLIAEATKTHAHRSSINVRHVGASLIVDIVSDGDVTETMTELEDRIGALDGTLIVDRNAGGLVSIRAEIPCGS